MEYVRLRADEGLLLSDQLTTKLRHGDEQESGASNHNTSNGGTIGDSKNGPPELRYIRYSAYFVELRLLSNVRSTRRHP